MKRTTLLFSIILLSTICCTFSVAQPKSSTHLLNYYFNTPACNWNEAIPIGNGRLGGMVFGSVEQEKIQTNEDTFWSGEPRNLQKPGTYKCLDEIRRLLNEGKTAEAEALINRDMLGPWNQSYMPLANILLSMPSGSYSNYRRTLDLKKGIVYVSYQQNGVNYKREIFASYPDQAIVIHLSADKKKSINLTAELNSAVKYQCATNKGQLIIDGQAPKHVEPSYQGFHEPIYEAGHGMRFGGRLMVKDTDGDVKTEGNKLHLSGASSATLLFVASTSFNGFDKDPYKGGKDEKLLCQQTLAKLINKNYQAIYQRHIKDYTALFNRVKIDLGHDDMNTLPINERIQQYKAERDPALTALYYQFGRYLLISSSRPGSQPANLQGIWNDKLQPAWSANWTLNCNAEINYWPIEEGNLSECHLPFIQMTQEASVDGARTAKNLYNCRGWIAHHNLDIWRTTWPVGGSGSWAIYQVGSAWMCQHIWEHYQYTLDKQFLRTYYPLMRDATLFYIDNLQRDKQGYWVTNPSISFENAYKLPNGKQGWACIGSSQDMQIIRSLFAQTMKVIDILGDNQSLKSTINKVYQKLAPLKISPTTGQLQEWNDDIDAADVHNGQVAQGWGLVESNLISLHHSPQLASAFRKTIEYRKPWHSYNSGSWTGAFPAKFWARLAEGDSTQMVVNRHFSKALYPNLTCQFFDSWQIDGNLGIASAIAEMLLQSQDGEINLLPALPSKYPSGYVEGLKARGGFEVSIYWNNGHLQQAIIKSQHKDKVSIRYKDKTKTLQFKPKERKTIVF